MPRVPRLAEPHVPLPRPPIRSSLAQDIATVLGLPGGDRTLVVLRESEPQPAALAAQQAQSFREVESIAGITLADIDRLEDRGLTPFLNRHSGSGVLKLDQPPNLQAALWASGSIYVLAVLGSAAKEDANGVNAYIALLQEVCESLKPKTLACVRPDRLIRTRSQAEVVLRWLRHHVEFIKAASAPVFATAVPGSGERWWRIANDAADTRATPLKGMQNARGGLGGDGKWFHRRDQTPFGMQRGPSGFLEVREAELPTLRQVIEGLAAGQRRRDIAAGIVASGLPPNRIKEEDGDHDKRNVRACSIVDQVSLHLADWAMGVHVVPFLSLAGSDIEFDVKQRYVSRAGSEKVAYVYALPVPSDLLQGLDRRAVLDAVATATIRKIARGAPLSAWLAELAADAEQPIERRHRWLRRNQRVLRESCDVANLLDRITPAGWAPATTSRQPRALPLSGRPGWLGADGREHRLATQSGKSYWLLSRDPDPELGEHSLARPWGPASQYKDATTIHPTVLHKGVGHAAARALDVSAPWLDGQQHYQARVRPSLTVDRIAAAETALASARQRARAAYEILLRAQSSGEAQLSASTAANDTDRIQALKIRQAEEGYEQALKTEVAAEAALEDALAHAQAAEQTQPAFRTDREVVWDLLVGLTKADGPVTRTHFDDLQNLLPRFRISVTDSRLAEMELHLELPDTEGYRKAVAPITTSFELRQQSRASRGLPLAMLRPFSPLRQYLDSRQDVPPSVPTMQADLRLASIAPDLQTALLALENPIEATRRIVAQIDPVEEPWQEAAFAAYQRVTARKGAAWYSTGTIPQEALDVLADKPSLTSTDLRIALSLTSSKTVQLLIRMERRALLRVNREDGRPHYSVVPCAFCPGLLTLHLPVPEIADALLCEGCLRNRNGIAWPDEYRDVVNLVRNSGRRGVEVGLFKSGHRSRQRSKTGTSKRRTSFWERRSVELHDEES